LTEDVRSLVGCSRSLLSKYARKVPAHEPLGCVDTYTLEKGKKLLARRRTQYRFMKWRMTSDLFSVTDVAISGPHTLRGPRNALARPGMVTHKALMNRKEDPEMSN
jgi:hypothetical protein